MNSKTKVKLVTIGSVYLEANGTVATNTFVSNTESPLSHFQITVGGSIAHFASPTY
jgi:hypothetical protein